MKCGKCGTEMVVDPSVRYGNRCPKEGCANNPLTQEKKPPVVGGYPVAPSEGDSDVRHSIRRERYEKHEDDFDYAEDGPWTGRHS